MSRAILFATALALAVTAALAQAAAMPLRVSACSCAVPGATLAEVAESAQVAIFSGTVGPHLGDRLAVAVDTWFVGPAASEIVFVRPDGILQPDGTIMYDTCALSLTTGETRLFVVHGGPGAVYETNNCLPGGRLDTQEGQHLLAEAAALFGGLEPPRDVATEPPTIGQSGEDWLEQLVGVVPVLLATVAASLLVLGAAAILVARRRPL